MADKPREIVFLNTDQQGQIHKNDLRALIEEYADQREQIAELKAKLAASDTKVVLLNEALNRSKVSNSSDQQASFVSDAAKRADVFRVAGRNWVDVKSYRRLQTELAAVQTQLEDANEALDFKQSELRMLTESLEESQAKVQTIEVDLENERETSQHLRVRAKEMRQDAIKLDQEADRLRTQLEQQSESLERTKQRIEGEIGKIAQKIGKQVGYLESLAQDVDPMPF